MGLLQHSKRLGFSRPPVERKICKDSNPKKSYKYSIKRFRISPCDEWLLLLLISWAKCKSVRIFCGTMWWRRFELSECFCLVLYGIKLNQVCIYFRGCWSQFSIAFLTPRYVYFQLVTEFVNSDCNKTFTALNKQTLRRNNIKE